MSDLRRDQPVPLYYQVEVALRRAIESGEFRDGRLATQEELVERYGVSRITIRSALRRLEEDGLIERHRGRGTFVRQDAAAKIERHPDHLLGFEDELRRQGATPSVEVLAVEEIEPPADIGRALALLGNECAHRVRRLGRANGEPLWLESRYYPPAVAAKMVGRDLGGASLANLLEQVLGVRIAGARLRVESASANARQARHLGVRRGHPLLVNQFAFYAADGRVLEVLRAAFRGDRYAFTFDLSPPTRSQHKQPWPQRDESRIPPWPMLIGHLRPEPADRLLPLKEGTTR